MIATMWGFPIQAELEMLLDLVQFALFDASQTQVRNDCTRSLIKHLIGMLAPCHAHAHLH